MSQIALEPQETTTKSELNGWKHPVLPPSDVYTPGVSPIKKEFLLPHKFRSQLNDAADRQKDPSSKLGSNAAAGDQPPSTPVEPAQDQQGGGQKRKEGEGEGEQEEASQQQQQQQQQQPVVKLKGAARRRAKREAAAAAEKEGRGQDGKRKKQKGQNKGRTFQRVGDAVQICHSFAVEGRCKFVGGPQSCKFSHDIVSYLINKERDIYFVEPPIKTGSLSLLSRAERETYLEKHYDDAVSRSKVEVPSDQAQGASEGKDEGKKEEVVVEEEEEEVEVEERSRQTYVKRSPLTDQEVCKARDDPVHHSLDFTTSCPMFSARGKCVQGWKCRFLGAHVKVVGPSVKAVENAGTDGEQGSKEGQDEKEGGVGAGQMLGFQGTGLELLTDEKRWSEWQSRDRPLVRSEGDKERPKVVIDDELNFASGELQRALRTRKYPLPKTKIVLDYLEKESQRLQRESTDGSNAGKGPLPLDFSSIGKAGGEVVTEPTAATSIEEMDEDAIEEMENNLRNSVATKTEARREEGLLSCLSSSDCIDKARLRAPEKRRLNWKGELYLAPLTTTGNLPFRRLCVSLGCDITCGEMGLCESFLQGNGQEWSLIRRWEGERIFGTQVCGNKPSLMVPAAETIASEFGEGLDFVDINSGCPIDLVYNKGAGSALLDHASKLSRIMRGMNAVLGDVPLTIKLRTGTTAKQTTHKLFARLQTEWGASATTLHGRSRQQRYKNDADWGYIKTCADTLRESVRLYNEQGGGLDGEEMVPIPIYGNGDVYSWQDYYERLERTGVDGEMIARGALIKPWIFTEIKERRDWDISSRERLDLVREFASNGLTHWGSDTQGVNTTRRFLCEMISFTHRYVPTGLLEQLPARINDRPPPFKGRDELETLLASGNSEDWVRISEMFLGKCPDDWKFTPKHKSNAYSDANEAQG